MHEGHVVVVAETITIMALSRRDSVKDRQTTKVGEFGMKCISRCIQLSEQLVVLAVIRPEKIVEPGKSVLRDRSFILDLREGHVAGLDAIETLVLYAASR